MDKDIHLVLKYRDTHFTVAHDFCWWVILDGEEYEGTIPAEYRTDGASVPRFLKWFIDSWEPCVAIPALIHDYLLDNKVYDRPFCDRIFWKKMIDFGMPLFKAQIAYWCVLIYGYCKHERS